ncbi:hypothetical protein [Deinococcus cellulosilyticus]|nr:hypothetical protein [Deinococcus cellulosilyticus]
MTGKDNPYLFTHAVDHLIERLSAGSGFLQDRWMNLQETWTLEIKKKSRFMEIASYTAILQIPILLRLVVPTTASCWTAAGSAWPTRHW